MKTKISRILLSAASRSARLEVVDEVEERRRERQQAAVQRDPVRGRRHRVLAHAVMDVAAAVRARLEVALALEVRLGRGIEIGRAADELGQRRRDRVHHRAAGVAGRDRTVLVGERRPRQLGGQLSVARALELRGRVGVVGFPGRVPLVPLAPAGRRRGRRLP